MSTRNGSTAEDDSGFKAGLDEEVETTEEFSKRINDVVLASAVCTSLAVGVEMGLFQKLCEYKRPASAKRLADETKCHESFVKSWLYHMAVADVVEVDSVGAKYYLPEYRRRILTETGGMVQELAPYLPRIGMLYEDLLRSFKSGNTTGSIARLAQSNFYKKWEARRKPYFVRLIDDIMVKEIPHLKEQLEKGVSVVDLGCSRGNFIFTMAEKYPNSVFTGADITDSVITEARDVARSSILDDLKLTNAGFVVQDAAELPHGWDAKFDVVCVIDLLTSLPRIDVVLAGVHRVLKTHGLLVLVDTGIDTHPTRNLDDMVKRNNALLAPVLSMNYTLQLSLALREGEGVGACVGKERIEQYAKDAGFRNISQVDFHLNDRMADTLLFAYK